MAKSRPHDWKADDGMVLKMMAQENMDEFNQDPKVAMDVIKTTHRFMMENQLLIPTATAVHSGRTNVLANLIAKFLAFKQSRVEDILANLRAVGEIEEDGVGKSKEVVPVSKEPS